MVATDSLLSLILDASAPEKPGFFTRKFTGIGKAVDRWGPVALEAVASVALLAVPDIFKEVPHMRSWHSYAAVLFIIATVLVNFLGVFFVHRRTALVGRLRKENEGLRSELQAAGQDYFEQCSSRLVTIGEQAKFRGCDRISLYRFEDPHFVMLGRSAPRPDLRKTGRGIYPADQGVIGKAWNSPAGRCFVDDLPDPVCELEAYKRANFDRFGFPEDVAEVMAMKSRTIAAYVLNDASGVSRSALLLFESLEASRFEDEHLATIVEGTAGRDLALMLEGMRRSEPSPSIAKQKGF